MRRVLAAVVVALLLAVLLPSTVHARPTECTIAHHTVKPGETLSSIGRLYGVSAMAIASYNGILNPNLIYPWQVLAIPCGCGAYWWGCAPYWPGYHYGCVCRFYHQIGGGENLYRISLQYGVSMWRIAQCNNIHNLNYIQLGRTLCIP